MIEFLIVFNLLLQDYFYKRCLVVHEEVKPDPYYQLIYGTGNQKESTTPKESPISESEKIHATSTELDESATALLSDLVNEFKEDKPDSCNDGDYLSMDDLDLDNSTFLNLPSSKVDSKVFGPQEWIVTVVGKEGNYLHVSDGKKKWVNVGKKSKDVYINDLLLLEVNKGETDIVVHNVTTLEHVTDAYRIPDEDGLYV